LAVRRPGEAADAGRLFDPAELPARRGLPESNDPVAARGGQRLAVRREGDGVAVRLPSAVAEPADLLAGGQVPEPNRLLARRRSEVSAVGRKGDGAGTALVPGQAAEFLAGGHLPQADTRPPVARGERSAVGGELHRGDGVPQPEAASADAGD